MSMGPGSKKEAEKNQAALIQTLNNFLAEKDELRPTVTDKATFDALVAAVEEATKANESVAAFAARVKSLGAAVEALAKTLGVLA